jgi:diguanylate cyclase (GGDEF)-like protein
MPGGNLVDDQHIMSTASLALAGFLPHGYCFLWQPNLLWLHVISDGLIALAYFSIPVAMFALLRKRRDLPFHWVVGMFGAFIICCGTTHVLEIVNVWIPVYWIAGGVKALTAVVSLATGLLLVPALPRLIRLPNPILDGLTGLPNRLLFIDRLQLSLARAKRQANKVAILFVDLDGFKDINDAFGHAFGDELLIAVSERLRTNLRAQDTVARFGGDEFVLLLDPVADAADATTLANRIVADLRRPIVVRGREVAVGASMGVAVSDGSEPIDRLLQDADRAMYVAKARVGDAYRVVDRSSLPTAV